MKKILPDISTGRWTQREHETFLVRLKEFGREWKKVAYNIPICTSTQIRSHAQKYFAKVSREKQQRVAALETSSYLTSSVSVSGGTDGTFRDHVIIHSVDNSQINCSPRMIECFPRILKVQDTVRREVEKTLCRLGNRYNELKGVMKKATEIAV